MNLCSSLGAHGMRAAGRNAIAFFILTLFVIGSAQATGGKAEQHYDAYRDIHGIERDVPRVEGVTTPSQTPSDDKESTRQREKGEETERDVQSPCAKGKLTAPLIPFSNGLAPGAQQGAQLRCV